MAILNCFPLVDAELDSLYKSSTIFPAYMYFDNKNHYDVGNGTVHVEIFDGSNSDLKRVGFYSTAETVTSRDHLVTVYPLRTFYIIPTLRGQKRSVDAIKAEPGHIYLISIKISELPNNWYKVYKDGELIYEYPLNTIPSGAGTDDGTLFYWSYTNE